MCYDYEFYKIYSILARFIPLITDCDKILLNNFCNEYKDMYVTVETQGKFTWFKYDNGLWIRQSDMSVDHDIKKYMDDWFNKPIKMIIKFYKKLCIRCDNIVMLEYYAKQIKYFTKVHRLNIEIIDNSKSSTIAHYFVNNDFTHYNIQKNLLSFGRDVYDFDRGYYREAHQEDYLSVCCNMTINDVIRASEEPINQLFELMLPGEHKREEFKKYLAHTLWRKYDEQYFMEIIYSNDSNLHLMLIKLLRKALGPDYCVKLNANLLHNKIGANYNFATEQSDNKFARVLIFNNVNPDKKINTTILKMVCANGVPILFSNRALKLDFDDYSLIRRQRQFHLAQSFIKLDQENINTVAKSMMKVLIKTCSEK